MRGDYKGVDAVGKVLLYMHGSYRDTEAYSNTLAGSREAMPPPPPRPRPRPRPVMLC